MLQYRAHVDTKEWREKKAAYEAENTRLSNALTAALAENDQLRSQLRHFQQGSPISTPTTVAKQQHQQPPPPPSHHVTDVITK